MTRNADLEVYGSKKDVKMSNVSYKITPLHFCKNSDRLDFALPILYVDKCSPKHLFYRLKSLSACGRISGLP